MKRPLPPPTPEELREGHGPFGRERRCSRCSEVHPCRVWRAADRLAELERRQTAALMAAQQAVAALRSEQ